MSDTNGLVVCAGDGATNAGVGDTLLRHELGGSNLMRDASFRQRQYPMIKMLSVVVMGMLLGACATPQSMHARAGVDPRYQDDDVRFRTTYYFRVFDVCDDGPKASDHGASYNKRIVSDSLYRFRMTGKSSSLSNVHFESGTLQAAEIEPLGASVAFDAKSGRFSVRSQRETAAEDAYNRTLSEVRDLLRLRPALARSRLDNETLGSALTELDARITGKLGELGEARSNLAGSIDPSLREIAGKRVDEIMKSAADTKTKIEQLAALKDVLQGSDKQSDRHAASVECSSKTHRGFQILGAEGWRTFDQDERLLMAMSSRAEPLIETLREVSHRVLDQKTSDSGLFRPLLTEHGQLQQAMRAARGDFAEQTSEQFMDAVLEAYDSRELP